MKCTNTKLHKKHRINILNRQHLATSEVSPYVLQVERTFSFKFPIKSKQPILSEGGSVQQSFCIDFTSPTSASWKKVLQIYAIKPMQQFAYTTGKNATDSTMIIDAMDLLYTRKFDGFCLITSDSDFTGLAIRLREEGLTVFGFGEQKTPMAFRNACNKFLFTEVLRPESSNDTLNQTQKTEIAEKLRPTPSQTVDTPKNKEFPKKFILSALDQSTDDTGWAQLGTFGSYLTKLQPDFDSRVYGFKKLSDLVKSRTDLFVTEERQTPSGNQKVLYLRAA